MNKFLEQYKKMSIQAKAAIWFVVCSILQKGISFVTVPIFTRLLTTEQYGTYSLYLSWLQILTIITSLYLYHGVFNNAMVKFENDRNRYISCMQGLTLLLDLGVFLIYILAFQFWSDILGLAPIIVLLMFAEMLVTPALQFWSGKQRFEYKYRKLVIVTLIKSVLNPLLGIIAVILFEQKDVARISSVVLSEVLVCGPIMIYQFVKGRSFFNKQYWKYALSLALPLLPHYLSGMVLNQSDRVMINSMVGSSEVAFYSVAYSIGMLTQIFTSAINSSFTPWMYQRIKCGNFKRINETINSLLIIIGVIVFCLIMLSPELVLIFGSEEYANAVYVIPPVAVSVFFIFLYNLLAVPQFYYEKTGFLMISSLGAAVLNLVLNYVFIKEFGYIAAGYTTLACYVLYGLGHYIISTNILKNVLQRERLYDSKFILVASIIMILCGILCNYLFDYWYIRYAILLVCAIVVVVKRKKIITIISGMRKIDA